MLSPHPPHKLQEDPIVIVEIVLLPHFFLLRINIKQDSGRHAGHTVEEGLGEIHFPFAVPGPHYLLVILLLRVKHFAALIYFYLCPYFLLVHCQDVQGLIEFYPLTGADIGHMVGVQHCLFIINIMLNIIIITVFALIIARKI